MLTYAYQHPKQLETVAWAGACPSDFWQRTVLVFDVFNVSQSRRSALAVLRRGFARFSSCPCLCRRASACFAVDVPEHAIRGMSLVVTNKLKNVCLAQNRVPLFVLSNRQVLIACDQGPSVACLCAQSIV